MRWFTADPHFNHAKIIEYCRRPFANVDEMNSCLIENWNAVVRDDDEVFCLGDFGFGRVLNIIRRLNGRIIFLQGSHDQALQEWLSEFREVTDASKQISVKNGMPIIGRSDLLPRALTINIGNVATTLSHYAMKVWPKSHYNAWHLFGHSHGKLVGIGKSFDVGMDAWGFTPISETAVVERMKNLPDNPGLIKKPRA